MGKMSAQFGVFKWAGKWRGALESVPETLPRGRARGWASARGRTRAPAAREDAMGARKRTWVIAGAIVVAVGVGAAYAATGGFRQGGAPGTRSAKKKGSGGVSGGGASPKGGPSGQQTSTDATPTVWYGYFEGTIVRDPKIKPPVGKYSGGTETLQISGSARSDGAKGMPGTSFTGALEGDVSYNAVHVVGKGIPNTNLSATGRDGMGSITFQLGIVVDEKGDRRSVPPPLAPSGPFRGIGTITLNPPNAKVTVTPSAPGYRPAQKWPVTLKVSVVLTDKTITIKPLDGSGELSGDVRISGG